MKKSFGCIFLLLIFISSLCGSRNKYKAEDISMGTVQVTCHNILEKECNRVKRFLLSDANLYLKTELPVECYGFMPDKKYYVLVGFDKHTTFKQLRLFVLDSLNFELTFASSGYGDMRSVIPKFEDLNADGQNDIVLDIEDESDGFLEIFLYTKGRIEFCFSSLIFPASDLQELGLPSFKIVDLDHDGLMELEFPRLIDDTDPQNRKILNNVVYKLKNNKYVLYKAEAK